MKFFIVRDGKIIKEIQNPRFAESGEIVMPFSGNEVNLKKRDLIIHKGKLSRLFGDMKLKAHEQRVERKILNA